MACKLRPVEPSSSGGRGLFCFGLSCLQLPGTCYRNLESLPVPLGGAHVQWLRSRKRLATADFARRRSQQHLFGFTLWGLRFDDASRRNAPFVMTGSTLNANSSSQV